VVKTFVGLCFEEAILSKIAQYKRSAYRLSTPAEEAQGIDGFIGDTAVSIKPGTYGYQGHAWRGAAREIGDLRKKEKRNYLLV